MKTRKLTKIVYSAILIMIVGGFICSTIWFGLPEVYHFLGKELTIWFGFMLVLFLVANQEYKKTANPNGLCFGALLSLIFGLTHSFSSRDVAIFLMVVLLNIGLGICYLLGRASVYREQRLEKKE